MPEILPLKAPVFWFKFWLILIKNETAIRRFINDEFTE